MSEIKDRILLKTLTDCIACPFVIPAGQVFVRQASFPAQGGICLIVHSNDHDNHFHVIHEGNKINARFSYPDIKLIDYKSRNKFNSRQIKNIITFCKIDCYHKKIGSFLECRIKVNR